MLTVVDICQALLAGRKVTEEELDRLDRFVSNSCAQNAMDKRIADADIEVRDNLSQTIGLTKYGNIITHPNEPGTTPKIDFSPEVEGMLERASESWRFDARELQVATDGHALFTLLLWLFESNELFDELPLDIMAFRNFARKLELSYPELPYHNTTHACEVLQATHMILMHGGVIEKVANLMHPRNSFAVVMASAYIAAAGHDVSHTGMTNDFLIRSKSSLAARYNDVSCNENLHLNVLLRLLDEDALLTNFTENTARLMRDIMINMVLRTDMHHHFSSCADFGGCDLDDIISPDQTAIIVLQMVIKCADLVHTAQTWEVHNRRVTDLEEECRLQGDQERLAEMRISAFMDRRRSGLTTAQVPFLTTLVKPMFGDFHKRFPQIEGYVSQLDHNISEWKKIAEKASVDRACIRSAEIDGADDKFL